MGVENAMSRLTESSFNIDVLVVMALSVLDLIPVNWDNLVWVPKLGFLNWILNLTWLHPHGVRYTCNTDATQRGMCQFFVTSKQTPTSSAWVGKLYVAYVNAVRKKRSISFHTHFFNVLFFIVLHSKIGISSTP